ncbi:hypothetical protein GCM10010964_29730 [Caldovatus sediminis]|uniref:Transposase IS66 zinc-finger binding domain-containing protein n=1 Tax=Caldovatus sediminis TaxID=2041189 RepID=A0A8J2ZDD6_9PROT|nr:hypothetical protein GCM10010964_29730 [Caldovatus sediminis]
MALVPTGTAPRPERRGELHTRGHRSLPDRLPHQIIKRLPGEGCTCRACGGVLRKVDKDVTGSGHALSPGVPPGRFEMARRVRTAFSCRICEAMAQAPMPSSPIERDRPHPGLAVHLLVSKCCDHIRPTGNPRSMPAGAPTGSGA